MVLRYSILLHFFNLMGILSGRISDSKLEVSYVQVVLNHLKNIALFAMRNQIMQFMRIHILPFVSEMKYSHFSNILRGSGSLQRFFQAALAVFLQQNAAHSHCNLINEMIDFRKHLERSCHRSKDLFEQFEVKCLRHFVIFSVVVLAAFLVGFFAFFPNTFVAFLAYTVSKLALFVSLMCVCYYYIIMQFLICCQDVLLLRALELKSSESYICFSQISDDLASWHSTLFSIKQKFMSITSLNVMQLIFSYISRIVMQVIQVS